MRLAQVTHSKGQAADWGSAESIAMANILRAVAPSRDAKRMDPLPLGRAAVSTWGGLAAAFPSPAPPSSRSLSLGGDHVALEIPAMSSSGSDAGAEEDRRGLGRRDVVLPTGWSDGAAKWIKSGGCGAPIAWAVFVEFAPLGEGVYQSSLFFDPGRSARGCEPPPGGWEGSAHEMRWADGRGWEAGGRTYPGVKVGVRSLKVEATVLGEGYHRDLAVSVSGGRVADWGQGCGVAVVWTMPSTAFADQFQVEEARRFGGNGEGFITSQTQAHLPVGTSDAFHAHSHSLDTMLSHPRRRA